MFYLLKVLVEHPVRTLDRPFSYAYQGDLVPLKGERVAVNFNNRVVIGFIVSEPEVIEMSLKEYNATQSYEIKPIVELIDSKPLFSEELFTLASRVAKYYHSTLISVYKTMLPPSLKPTSSFRSKPKESFVKMIVLNENAPTDIELSKSEIKALEALKEKGGEVRYTSFGKTKTVALLYTKKLIDIVDRKVNRLASYHEMEYSPKELTKEQQDAYQTIIDSPSKIFLLEGVTGSGKTEVYFKLAEYYRSIGKSILILEPEIALTSRVVTIFKSKFKDDVAVLHSGETPANLYDEYLRIANGEANIVIGARSAVFAPLNNLGLIIIDEEHSNTYKQENDPFYHARTVAIMRSEQLGNKVLLASATPSLETKARADKGIYQQLFLTQRFTGYSLPSVKIVDMSDLANIDADSVIISLPLRAEIEKTLALKKQVLLFINRRGYAPVYACRKCGRIFRCPNCDVPLTYHKDENIIKCHHCEYEMSAHELKCPSCGGTYFSNTGFGTEKIVDEVKRLFPYARIARLDSDIASKRKEFQNVLYGFQEHEYDILIGTQMIAKGHDFKDVELVSALMADKSLSIPNYKAAEDTFDLLTQLIGRAGRQTNTGSAIIQTYSPDNEVIKYSVDQDYPGFYKYEMHNRQVFQYPPYTFLAIVTLSGSDADKLDEFSYKIKNYLVSSLKDARANIYGPSYPYIKKLNNRFYRKLMIKYKSLSEVNQVFEDLFALADKDFKITLDIDPVADC